MQLKYHWPLSPTVRESILKVGQELIFPTVTDNKNEKASDEDMTRVDFGLWCINVRTGEEREIKAPFYIERDWGSARSFKWESWSSIRGVMVFTLMSKGSYEYNYHLFSFDGTTWKQMRYPGKTQIVVFDEQAFKTWTEPGRIELSDFPLSGGSLAVSGGPLTFAADYTHAFSYDNGPMTPTSPEYESIRARPGGVLKPGLKFGGCDLNESTALLQCLPADHPIRLEENKWMRWVKIKEGLLLVDRNHHVGMRGVTLIQV